MFFVVIISSFLPCHWIYHTSKTTGAISETGNVYPSFLVTGFITRVRRRVPWVEQEMFTLPSLSQDLNTSKTTGAISGTGNVYPSFLVTWFITRVRRQVPWVEQDMFTLPSLSHDLNTSKTTGAISGAGTVYPSRAHEFCSPLFVFFLSFIDVMHLITTWASSLFS